MEDKANWWDLKLNETSVCWSGRGIRNFEELRRLQLHDFTWYLERELYNDYPLDYAYACNWCDILYAYKLIQCLHVFNCERVTCEKLNARGKRWLPKPSLWMKCQEFQLFGITAPRIQLYLSFASQANAVWCQWCHPWFPDVQSTTICASRRCLTAFFAFVSTFETESASLQFLTQLWYQLKTCASHSSKEGRGYVLLSLNSYLGSM